MDDKKVDLLKILNTSVSSKQKSFSLGNNRFSISMMVIFLLMITILIFFQINQSKNSDSKVAQNISKDIDNIDVTEDFDKINTSQRSWLVASGYVVARRQATIAAEITGRIAEVLIEEGKKVKAGEILAKLDSTLAITERDAADSQLKAVQATVKSLVVQLKAANYTAEHCKELYMKGVTSQAVFIEAKAKSDSLAAQLEQAKSQSDVASLELKRRNELVEKHVLRAPFDSVVISKNAQPGEIISPVSAGGGFTRTGIATLVDMDSLEVEVDVNESNIAMISPDSEAVAILDAYPQWNIAAKVIAVIPTASREKATIKVRVMLKEKDPRILPNMAIKVNFIPLSNGTTKSITNELSSSIEFQEEKNNE
jgi:HlyD family secretion protein